jgi:hypothetical protein
VQSIAIRIGLFVVVGIGALVARPFITGGAADLKVGECFDVPATSAKVDDVQHHPCSEAHIDEVIFVGKFPAAENAAYPSDTAFEASVGSQCLPAFESYSGLKFETAQAWDIGYFVPLAKDWATGDRGLICYALRVDEKPTTTSLKKS